MLHACHVQQLLAVLTMHARITQSYMTQQTNVQHAHTWISGGYQSNCIIAARSFANMKLCPDDPQVLVMHKYCPLLPSAQTCGILRGKACLDNCKDLVMVPVPRPARVRTCTSRVATDRRLPCFDVRRACETLVSSCWRPRVIACCHVPAQARGHFVLEEPVMPVELVPRARRLLSFN